MKKLLLTVVSAIVFLAGYSPVAMAAEEGVKASGGNVIFFAAIAIAAGIGMGIGAFGTGIGQGNAVRGAVESIAYRGSTSRRYPTTLTPSAGDLPSRRSGPLVVALI